MSTTVPVVPKQFEFDSYVGRNLGPVTRASSPPACGDWVKFLRGVVAAESGWKADNVFQEKFLDSASGQLAKSVGYFQLSLGDKNNYHGPACQKLTEESLKDPETNTGCALEIIESLLRSGRKLGAYWSTIRDGKVSCNG